MHIEARGAAVLSWAQGSSPPLTPLISGAAQLPPPKISGSSWDLLQADTEPELSLLLLFYQGSVVSLLSWKIITTMFVMRILKK